MNHDNYYDNDHPDEWSLLILVDSDDIYQPEVDEDNPY